MVVKEETRIKFSSNDKLDEQLIKEDKDNLKTAKVQMDQVREENERLKLTLSHVMKDYNSLKMQFNGLIQEDHHHHPKKSPIVEAASDDHESELVCLSLGRFSGNKSSRNERKSQENNIGNRDGLDLGLDWKFHSNDSNDQLSKNQTIPDQNSSDGSKDGNEEARASRKSPRTSRSGDDNEILQHVPLKKPRVSVRALCNTQTMNDGCQWRKYGQKISKGNPCPRAYYRCTVSSSCPVRKQVQRCVEDMTILITTYEGTHNHPLPPSATTMASATSAAADMLKCGSSASPPGHGVSATSSTTTTNFSTFNFASSNNLNISHFPRATISSSQSHPTVILDLTAPNHHSINHHNKFPSRYAHSSSSSLDFSSSNSSFDANTLQIGWENKFHSANNGASTNYYQPSLYNSIQASQKQVAKAITCDPTFQSALAAAITSMVGNNVHATSFLNKFPQSGNSQQKNLPQFPPLTLPASKSQAVSLADEGGEQVKVMSFGI